MKKLARDRIPEIISNADQTITFYTATDAEYKMLLKEKLLEEAHEFIESETTEEMADILEVIDAICAAYHIDLTEVQRVKNEKRMNRGGFKTKLVIVKE
jgi:predicted house-cleaning noncanonical NTP pyrophosphatase (MazG superfamily)